VRALTIHSFTNQPVRLLRVLRFAARMGFKVEGRTQEWFDLAIERELHRTIEPEDAGAELREAAREERPTVVLKAWEEHDLMEAVSPLLAKKHPDYEAIGGLVKIREDLMMAGLRPRLATPMLAAILGKMKDRELSGVLSKAGFKSAEAATVLGFEEKALAIQKELVGRKLEAPIDAYKFIEKTPTEQVAYLLAESRNSAAVSKIKAYLNKWRPMRASLPVVGTELQALGMERGAKFDEIIEQVFAVQLTGRGKTPEEREKLLRKLSGIREIPKKKEKEKKPSKAEEKALAAANAEAKQKHSAGMAARRSQTAGKSGTGKPAGKPAPKVAKKAAPAKKAGGKK
jgi:tRNA nucleotidyltransferase/poly(A) polymerase